MTNGQRTKSRTGRMSGQNEARYRYEVAIAIALVGAAVRLAFLQGLGTRAAFVTFFPAVILAALYGGLGPGLLATIVSLLLADYFWTEPAGLLLVNSTADWLSLAIFFITCSMISVVVEAMYRAQERAKLAETEARLAGERQHAAEALSKSEELYRVTLQALPAHIAVLDRQGRILAINLAWTEFAHDNEAAGSAAVEIGANYLDVCRRAVAEGDADANMALSAIEALLDGSQEQFTMEYPCHGPQQQRWFLMTGVQLGPDGEGGAVISHLNITKRKMAEEALRHVKEEWERTFDSVQDLIAIMDADHRIVRANRAMAELLGTAPEQCVGRHCFSVMHGSDHAPGFCPHTMTLYDGHKHETVFQDNRTGADFLVTTTPLRNEHGQTVGTVHVARDITEQKRMETELRRSRDELEKRVQERTTDLAGTVNALLAEIDEREKAEESLREKEHMLLQQNRQAAMGEMINNIAHQWRQPLNSVGLYVQSLLLHYDEGHFTREFLQSTSDETMKLIRHMSRTIDDFRDFFRSDKEMIEFSPEALVQMTVSLVHDGFTSNRIDIVSRVHDSPIIHGYFNQLCQVLLNILLNARDAIVERKIASGRVILDSAVEDGRAVILITDNAGGIPVEIIDRIFEPYFSTKGVQGTGIGLFMSKKIIENHMGGRITVRNTDDGAEFRIVI